MLNQIKNYLHELFSDWIQICLLILDLIGLVIFLDLLPTIFRVLKVNETVIEILSSTTSIWLGGTVILLSLIIANFRIYWKLKTKLAAFEVQTPELRLIFFDYSEAYIDKSNPVYTKVHLLFDVEIQNISIWPAQIEDIFVSFDAKVWPLKDWVVLWSKALELAIPSPANRERLQKLFGTGTLLLIESAAYQIAPPDYVRFSEKQVRVRPKENQRVKTHLEFNYYGKSAEFKAWLNQYSANKASGLIPIDFTVIYSYDHEGKSQKSIFHTIASVFVIPIAFVLDKKSRQITEDGMPVWYHLLMESMKDKDDWVREKISQGLLELKNQE